MMMTSDLTINNSDVALLLSHHGVEGHDGAEHNDRSMVVLLQTVGDLAPSRGFRLWIELGDYPDLPTQPNHFVALATQWYGAGWMNELGRVAAALPGDEDVFGRIFDEEERRYRPKLESAPEQTLRTSKMRLHHLLLDFAAAQRATRTVEVVCELPTRKSWTRLIANRLCLWNAMKQLQAGSIDNALRSYRGSLERLRECSITRDETMALRMASSHKCGTAEVIMRGGFHYHFLPTKLSKLGMAPHWRLDLDWDTSIDPHWEFYKVREMDHPASDELVTRVFIRSTVALEAMKNHEVFKRLADKTTADIRCWPDNMHRWMGQPGMTPEKLRDCSLSWVMTS